MSRRLHLNLNMLNAGVYGGAWRWGSTDPTAFVDIEHYLALARLAERAKLDAVFLADALIVAPDARFRPFQALEPTVVLTAVAAATERIGLIGTASTSYSDPFNLARRLLTLDRISGGRLGWNVVTTAGDLAPRNFGRDAAPAHAERYERAAEFVDVVLALWRSFPEDAIIGDRESGEFLDLERVRTIDHNGHFFRVRGPLNVPSSAQGHPVIVQAGASEDGKQFAARYAEAIFTVAKSLADGQAFSAELKRRARDAGRDPAGVVVLPGISTVIGGTEAEAHERRRAMEDLVHPEYALGRLGELLGVDPDALELDAGLPDWIDAPPPGEFQASESFRASTIAFARREGLTVRDLLRRLGGGAGHRIVAGAPEQIADDMEAWFRAGAADGFNVMPDALPDGAVAFVEQVVPELQRRGLFRTEYDEVTLRSRFGLPLPDAGILRPRSGRVLAETVVR